MLFLIESETHFKSMEEQITKFLVPIWEVYPNFDHWFHEKVIPNLTKDRKIFVNKSFWEDEIISVMIIKDGEEKKVCTLLVGEKYRRKNYGSIMLQTAHVFLETDKPIITVHSSKLKEFEPLFKKFKYKQTAIENEEIIFN